DPWSAEGVTQGKQSAASRGPFPRKCVSVHSKRDQSTCFHTILQVFIPKVVRGAEKSGRRCGGEVGVVASREARVGVSHKEPGRRRPEKRILVCCGARFNWTEGLKVETEWMDRVGGWGEAKVKSPGSTTEPGTPGTDSRC